MPRSPRGARGLFAGLVVIASMCAVSPVPVWSQPESAVDHHVLSAEFTAWLTAVARHAPGEPDAAAGRVAAWPDTTLRDVLREFDTLERALTRATERRRPLRPRGTSPDGELMTTVETLSLIDIGQDDIGRGGSLSSLARRGVLLHTDLAVFLHDGRITAPLSSGVDERGALRVIDGEHRGFGRRWPHWDVARELLTRRLHDQADADVARQWYVAAAAYMFGRGRLVDMLPHVEEGERHFRTAPDLLFYAGLMHARMASPALQHAVRQASASVPEGRASVSPDARAHLERARGLLTRAIEAGPGMAEASVRLGHVLLELRQPREAAVHLRRALDGVLDSPLRYCAELFLGDALAALDEADEARQAFERASALYPHAQSPWVSLSRLARAQGDRAGAAGLLERVLTPEPAARRFDDPWWTYHLRDLATPERLLDEWRRAVFAGSAAP